MLERSTSQSKFRRSAVQRKATGLHGCCCVLSLVLLLSLANPCLQQTQKLQLEEHVTQKASFTASRVAGVAHAAAHLQLVLHDKLEALQTGDIHIVVRLPLGGNKHSSGMVLDTGSNVMWIKREECGPSGDNTLGQDCTKANTPAALAYSDGVAHGFTGNTGVWLEGGSKFSPNHKFTVIDSLTFKLNFGILGLSRGNQNQADTFITTLKRNGLIKEEAFSIAKRPDGLYLVLGGVDQSWVTPQSTRVEIPIKSTIAYYIDVDKVTFGSETLIGSTTQSLIDSGNSLVSFPWVWRDAIISAFGRAGLACNLRPETNRQFSQMYCQFEKGRDPNVPDISFSIGGKIFKLPFKDLPMRERYCSEIIPAYADFDSDSPRKEMCPLRIEFDSSSSMIIIGQVFIQENYVTFNLEKQTITIIQ